MPKLVLEMVNQGQEQEDSQSRQDQKALSFDREDNESSLKILFGWSISRVMYT